MSNYKQQRTSDYDEEDDYEEINKEKDDDESLDDEAIEELEQWKLDNIYKMTLDVLNKLQSFSNMSDSLFTELFEKFKNYRYIDDLDELKNGSHILYINLKKLEELKTNATPIKQSNEIKGLVNPAIFCKPTLNNSNKLVCKGFGFIPKHFQICFNNNIIFQKFNNDELLLIQGAEVLF